MKKLLSVFLFVPFIMFSQTEPYVYYHENGQLDWEADFKDGILISETCWDEQGKEINCDY
jgi:hypothetical protein